MRSGLELTAENLGFGLGQNAPFDTLLSDGDFVYPFHHICALFWARVWGVLPDDPGDPVWGGCGAVNPGIPHPPLHCALGVGVGF